MSTGKNWIKKKSNNKKNFFVRLKKKIKNKKKYSVKEVSIIMVFSLGIGFFMCFGCISLFTGKNYLTVSRDLDKVVDTYYAIVDNYYGELDEDALIDGAIEGMVSSVGDSYTSYTNTDDAISFDQTINGSYEGIGCSIATYVNGSIVVIDVFDDSPASLAGLEVGDIVTKVDGVSYEGKTSTELSSYVKDSGKEKVVLTILRGEEEKEITVNLSKVEIPYVHSQIIEKDGKNIGYIDISLFSSVTYKQFKNELEELEESGIDGLVIDVRDNNGGYLTSVTDICNLFLKKGDIIYMLEDSSGTEKKKDTTKEKREYEVVVLINRASASASEILASAIKESYDGHVVGTNSYGKGTVQQTKKLLDGSMIKYTTQRWLTPSGNCIDGIGVEPTNVVELSNNYYNNPSMSTDDQLQEALNLLIK
ncbi:MAG: S41 family peptidase [Bacilli bacterium]|nr:S41 family peptidase [Bacilli bacterium]